jgi:hypothetical protein
MRAVRFNHRSVPFVFALITMMAYGLLLPLTGYYWDDWPFAWIARFLGPAEFIPAFQGFRPFLGPLFFLTTSSLPAHPLAWQLVALVIRLAAAMAAWYALDQVWPRGRTMTFSAAALFLVFPGYSQHWVALTHVNQEWIPLIAYLISFGLSFHALRTPARFLGATIAALLLQIIGLLPTEYFLGMELLRPIFFWVVLAEPSAGLTSRCRAAFKAWLPYLVVWLINAAWLIRYYRSGNYISYDLAGTSGAAALSQALPVFADALWKAGIYVWFQVLPLAAESLSSPASLASLALVVVSFLLLTLYLSRLELAGPPRVPENRMQQLVSGGTHGPAEVNHARWAIATGLFGILLGRVPSFAAGLPLTLQSSFDRLMISMMLGAGLCAAGVLGLLISSSRLRIVVLAALLALGIGQQFFNANIFRRDWSRQNDIYWQLAWRIPDLLPQTAILTQQMPLDYETDLAMTAALNWMYASEIEPPDLPYAMLYTEKRLGGDALPELRPGISMRLPFRTMEFVGSTSQVIAVYVPADGCLRVFDPAFDDAMTYSVLPESITAAIPLSDPSRILASAPARSLTNPPFTGEPVHGWCYFYEKAELSRQLRDWEGIIALRADAAREGSWGRDPFELLPFIEAEARHGDVGWAVRSTLEAFKGEPKLQRGLCALWRRVGAGEPTAHANVSAEVLVDLGCSP